MNNKRLGTAFEKRVCALLSANGYWVHFITPDIRGAQPFDIVAIKNGKALAVECKTLEASKKSFNISRLEDNQICAFEKWLACGNEMPMVFIEHGEQAIYVCYYKDLREKGTVKLKEMTRIE